MTCITHAILPACDDPQSAKDWVLDKQALRRIVRRIIAADWDRGLKQDFLSSTCAARPDGTPALARLTPSELTNAFSVETLLNLVVGTINTSQLRTHWLGGGGINLSAHSIRSILDVWTELLGPRPMAFGPFEDQNQADIAAAYLNVAGHSLVGGKHVRVGFITNVSTVDWKAAASVGRPGGGGSHDLTPWPEIMRPVAAIWNQAKGAPPVWAATPDDWALRRQRADELTGKAKSAALIPASRPPAKANATTSTTSTKENEDMTIHANTSTAAPALVMNEALRNPLNALLQAAGLPAIEALIKDVNEKVEYDRRRREAVEEAQKINAELVKLKANSVGAGVTLKIDASVASQPAQGGWPAYKVGTAKADQLFGVPSSLSKTFDFDVPVFTWDAPCAAVPKVDPDYIFRPHVLLSVIYALVTGENIWLSGHTGTGKSTLVEQVCARLGWPMARVNLDSEITRLDLMGRDIITQVNGQTVTRFEEGILPQAVQRPMVLLLDECDFGRPDVMYCLQRVTEGNGVTLTEDGGRYIPPHPLFRVCATANTLGQGDETGLYQGARIQSAAFLDRFTVWANVEAMDRDSIAKLVRSRVQGINPKEAALIAQYVHEHGVAFRERQVGTPVSPRSAISIGRAYMTFSALMPADKARQKAMAQAIVDRAPETDRKVLVGIADRVWK